jgi:bifunctional non-homologous end joining protein LigD
LQLYAFDCLVLGDGNLRSLPLHMRRTNLAELLAMRPDRIFIAPFERGEIGPDLFRAACTWVFEGSISKRREHTCKGGRCQHWVKMKNPAVVAKEKLRFDRRRHVTAQG